MWIIIKKILKYESVEAFCKLQGTSISAFFSYQY